jgi:hypothetical protein
VDLGLGFSLIISSSPSLELDIGDLGMWVGS